MKFLSITGPKADIDRVVEQYLSKYEIHLENTLAELKTVQTLTPYIQTNPYKEELKKAEELVNLLPDEIQKELGQKMDVEEAIRCVSTMNEPLVRLRAERDELRAEQKKYQELAAMVEPFQDLPAELEELKKFRFIRCRFGRIPREYYTQFENYVYGKSDSLYYRCHSDNKYVWGAYFTPSKGYKKTDAAYTSMHFERVYLPDELQESPQREYNKNIGKVHELSRKIEDCDNRLREFLKTNGQKLIGAKQELEAYSRNFDVRKLAACTKSKNETFYIMCGWMAASDAAKFQKEIENDADIFCFVEDNDTNISTEPPTKLKNPKIFKPFEMFIRMYGLPGYNEFDPTIYLAITYSFIFGIMFGDVGQGLCFVIGGFLLYKKKGTPLAAIMGTAGIFSTIWGLVYNSFFGFEGFFPYEALLHAKEDMMTLPGLGNLNVVFVLSIAFGMIMLLINMLLGVVNAVRQHDVENIFFSQNAIAGMVFYGCIVVTMFLVMSGKMTLQKLLPFMIVPLLASLAVVFLKEMFAHIAEKKKPIIEGGKGMYFVQAFFETFETLLSYLSNTLSYVRIGAYAVSHVAMMEVVMMLAGANTGNGNIAMIIFGNIFVAAMEGLMVAIQVLRLEYYEMFSRFYKGNGREFKPFISRK